MPMIGKCDDPDLLGQPVSRRLEELLKPLPAGREDELQRCREECEARRKAMRLGRSWADLIRKRGARYRTCGFKTFVFSEDREIRDRQTKAIGIAKRYAGRITEMARSGKNLVLFGPKGAGKDHILIAVLRHAIHKELSVDWFRGRDLIESLLWHDPSRSSLAGAFSRARVVGVSDPLPPGDALSGREANAILSLIDDRYSSCRPTIWTVNAKDRAQLEEKLGAAAADRILEGAAKACFNWPSYRQAQD
jgi:DNA replication protein DnaC